jgi:hypothetical protein
MPVPDFSPGEVLTAAAMDSIGLWLVKTVSIGSGVSAVDVTSCFSSDFSNYQIEFDNVIGSTAINPTVQFLVGTTPTITGYYGSQISINLAGAITGIGFSNVSAVSSQLVTDTAGSGGHMNVYAPNKATKTTFISHGIDPRTSGGSPLRMSSSFQDSSTQFDGIRFTAGSGATFTSGTIRVYGIRN